jgi:thioredoxin-related protein
LLTLIVIFASLSQAVSAEESERWLTTYRAALKTAAAEEKPMLLSFHAEWCGWCKVMDKEVFGDAALQGRLDEFVCVKIDIEGEPKTALAFEVTSVPRTILLNTSSQVISDTLGYLEPKAFAAVLDAAAPNLDREMPEAESAPTTDTAEVKLVLESIQVNGQSATLPESVLAYLSHPDPDVRAETREALAAHEDAVVPGLVQALGSTYLGTRISAHELLQQLTGEGVAYDPWAPATDRSASLREWQDTLAGDR